ncbi:MAG: bifunctional phosphoribosylaminoimidazolecarboxamide formyltransferase/IMP cyclohydrolase [Peptoniphilus sp.]|nr:bifunctional phosphoribosylaminoimidazolecarboxamide formyltransferase/IMP cyclohydrolase [Peptoniphilus sp.]MDD7363579.1 bifunctional phosphoribosylaminoimidazolecarboxamide formyltransferase/IMP cyclohydrolase [Bacillota bacterium]MDY6045230.1 bifunctional phosphoribosylaminoimidazolecarboxamide formyltransferase/IMP cyclohydrolase [Peptoniphilus sp.]
MKYALLSVTDKTGIGEFAKGLTEEGFTILSTGGTLKAIEEAGVEVTAIDEYTEFPEMLDGRVKTLHPKVHGGILYKRDEKSHVDTVKEHGIADIDLICVNLYAFEETYHAKKSDAELIENIDIGGPTLIRSAAKNHKDVYVVTDPEDYDRVLEHLKAPKDDLAFRRELAMKAFSLTAYYDSMISRYFRELTGRESDYLTIGVKKDSDLRYGENPHQSAEVYTDPMVESYFSHMKQFQGKELSYNNYNDFNSAVGLAGEFDADKDGIICVGLKHATPCGVALGETALDAYKKMFEADSLSIFGGIVALNTTVDKACAEEMVKIFLEVVAAKDFTDEALEVFKQKKNLRVIQVDFDAEPLRREMRMVSGKVLFQDMDLGAEEGYDVVTDKAPTEAEKRDLLLGMKIVKYVRSNAVVLIKDGQTLGVGGGETSRIWALENIFNHNPDRDFTGSVMASDAFFPFDDCVKAAAKEGVRAIIQPGGSIRDDDSIKACNENDMSMVFTGVRHFRH